MPPAPAWRIAAKEDFAIKLKTLRNAVPQGFLILSVCCNISSYEGMPPKAFRWGLGRAAGVKCTYEKMPPERRKFLTDTTARFRHRANTIAARKGIKGRKKDKAFMIHSSLVFPQALFAFHVIRA